MLDISRRMERAIGEFLTELPDTRGRVTMNTDSDGIVHLKGATDTSRRTIDPLHSALGYTSQDVTDLRKHLKAIGITLSLEETEAALTQAQTLGMRGNIVRMDEQERKRKNREKIQRRREWARANGYCIICTKNAASFRDDGSQCSTCRECQAKANQAKKK